MKLMSLWCLVSVLALVAGTESARGDEFVEMGEYVSGAAVFGGKRGHFAGNNQQMVFKDSRGNVLWSTRGGWTNGSQGQVSSDQARRIREEMRREKADVDRQVREGRRSVEYGEYVSGGATFHGYAGHWSGNNQKSVFVSREYGIIYSSSGGWVDGFGPEYDEPARSKWGVGISDEAQVYGNISDPNTLRRVAGTEANQLYMVVERDRQFVTVAYDVGGRTVLANKPLSSGTIVPGSMIGKPGGKYQFVLAGRGFRFDPL